MKKVISTVLACTVLFGLAACNTTETSVTTSEETTVTETTEELLKLLKKPQNRSKQLWNLSTMG